MPGNLPDIANSLNFVLLKPNFLYTPFGLPVRAHLLTTLDGFEFLGNFCNFLCISIFSSKVGGEIAKKAIELGHKKVTFDRSGYKYHGRVKALADGAREGGLEF